MDFLLLYLIVVNIITFFGWGWDKRQARREKQRISEKTLLTWIAVGGGVGAILAMQTFRHKTIKGSFLKKALSLIALWVVVLVIILYKTA